MSAHLEALDKINTLEARKAELERTLKLQIDHASELEKENATLEEALRLSRCPTDHHYKLDIICPRCIALNQPKG